jgi:hypothetical protein
MQPFLRLLIIFSFVFISVKAQNPIPNPGFESWTGNVPNGWAAPANIPQSGTEPVMKSPEAYSDSWAVRGIVLNAFGVPYPPVLMTGTAANSYFPVSANHSVFSCFFKFSPEGGDRLYIQIVFSNPSIPGGGEGNAFVTITNTQIFEKLEIPIEYDPQNPPGWHASQASITITIAPQQGQTPHINTWFLLDHFTFDNLPIVTSVKEINNIPSNLELQQNYPNPFNPTTNIRFELPEESFVNLTIYNVQGEEIDQLINEKLSAGTYNAHWNAAGLPSGMYVYTLRVENTFISRKMILMK